MSFDKRPKEINTSKQTLISWSQELELEINNLKSIELEILFGKYFMTKQKRIEVFGSKIKAIKEELDKRNLSDISTEKLIELLIKYYTILKQEKTDTTFKIKTGILDGFDFDGIREYAA